MKKLAPILLMEAIEPSLPFWTRTLGFDVTQSLEHEGRLGFVMLAKGDIEVHLQTRAATQADSSPIAEFRFPPACVLYFDVDSVEALVPTLEGLEVVVPLRKTFYGATEIYVREPSGHIVGFASF